MSKYDLPVLTLCLNKFGVCLVGAKQHWAWNEGCLMLPVTCYLLENMWLSQPGEGQ
jgi:hypothetical protein